MIGAILMVMIIIARYDDDCDAPPVNGRSQWLSFTNMANILFSTCGFPNFLSLMIIQTPIDHCPMFVSVCNVIGPVDSDKRQHFFFSLPLSFFSTQKKCS